MKRYELKRDLPTFKAGEIFYLSDIGNLIHESDGVVAYSWSTIDKFPNILTDWFEEIKPAEPLIKDEKIRKAVRAWAELIPSAQVRYDHSDGRFYTRSDYIVPYSISFPAILGLDETKDYTIAELCGEEEE